MLVGITGGFSSGKSTVAKYFGLLGAKVVDADKIVHDLYKRNQRIKGALAKEFGEGVLSCLRLPSVWR